MTYWTQMGFLICFVALYKNWPQKLHQAVGVIDKLGDTLTPLFLEITIHLIP
jgi:hypothetical protein